MLKLDFDRTPGKETHVCEARREGDWIVYTCPKCPGYERRINQRTDEMKYKGFGANVRHEGKSIGSELLSVFINTN